jgi:hypothetical protein
MNKSSINITAFAAVLLWTAVLLSMALWSVSNEKSQTRQLLTYQARAYFQEIVTARTWNAAHGGVYVPITSEMQPNPYLSDPERDIITQSGKKLTKVNPAFMTRQISEIAGKKNLFWFHITSDKPIRPENAPDQWENHAIETFLKGANEIAEFSGDKQGKIIFRYMAPLWVENACLKCHFAQGYKEGDLRGGISVSISGEPILSLEKTVIKKQSVAYLGIWLVGLFSIFYGHRKLKKDELTRAAITAELKESLAKTKTLSGLLPICSMCKKVRDDKGYWNQIDAYIEEHSDAEFSHSICQECAKKYYPDLDLYDDDKNQG